ncbi:MAG: hypothetical protein HY694_18625 [Deltaproteobacteria bacterium]|nr:hypothetical protein [Deltaproteobacteria bacterium]
MINVSVEGVFVAVAIGYGFEEERGRTIEIRQVSAPFKPGDITLGQIPPEALITGFRLDPRFEPMVFQTEERDTARKEKRFSDQPLPRDFGSKLFQRVKPLEEISFLFSIIDSATGRELQDEPTHNLASLGKSNGERPFRLLAQPLTFQPRSTMRLQVIERSEGIKGTLFIVLYGYKMLVAGCPEPLVRTLRGSPACPTETIGSPSARVVPFDYVARLELIGRPKNIVQTEVPINVEGGFVATAIGYGLQAELVDVPIQVPEDGNATFDLYARTLENFPADALIAGFRIRQNFLRIAFQGDGNLTTSLDKSLANRIFESLNRSEDVSFRYTIFDSGTGRELQNRPIHNIAGLGIANGDRPFKKFARPMVFFPRSTIRVTIQEHFGRGTLFFVFQGYKVLGAPSGVRR